MAKMTKQEKEEFDKLYEYVKTNVLGYNVDMSLPKFMVMRLKGMSEGKYFANKKTKTMASYDYNTIYLTFIYCKDKIQKALQTKNFANEQAKFNYICAIVGNNLNDVIIKLNKAKKAKEKIQNTEIVDYEIKVDKKANSITNSEEINNQTFNSLTNNLW